MKMYIGYLRGGKPALPSVIRFSGGLMCVYGLNQPWTKF